MSDYLEAKSAEDLCVLLGLPKSQAPKVEMRRDLVMAIRRVLEKRELTHAAAAKKAGVGRTVITAVANGNITTISTDRLIDIAHALGLTVKIRIAVSTALPRLALSRAKTASLSVAHR